MKTQPGLGVQGLRCLEWRLKWVEEWVKLLGLTDLLCLAAWLLVSFVCVVAWLRDCLVPWFLFLHWLLLVGCLVATFRFSPQVQLP